MSKIALVSVEAFRKVKNVPIKQSIGEECEAYFRKLSLDEFFEVQKKLEEMQELTKPLSEEESSDQSARTKKMEDVTNASKNMVADLMIDLIVTEKGDLAFKATDKEALMPLVTQKFCSNFVDAFMSSQGVNKEDGANAERDFRPESRTPSKV
jgi:hypothetical protein